MIYFEQGTEHWLPEAKRFLERLEKTRARTGAQSISRAMVPAEGVVIWAKATSQGHKIHITGGVSGRFVWGNTAEPADKWVFRASLAGSVSEEIYIDDANAAYVDWSKDRSTAVSINPVLATATLYRGGATFTVADVGTFWRENGGEFAVIIGTEPFPNDKPPVSWYRRRHVSISPDGKTVYLCSADDSNLLVKAVWNIETAVFDVTRVAVPAEVQSFMDGADVTWDTPWFSGSSSNDVASSRPADFNYTSSAGAPGTHDVVTRVPLPRFFPNPYRAEVWMIIGLAYADVETVEYSTGTPLATIRRFTGQQLHQVWRYDSEGWTLMGGFDTVPFVRFLMDGVAVGANLDTSYMYHIVEGVNREYVLFEPDTKEGRWFRWPLTSVSLETTSFGNLQPTSGPVLLSTPVDGVPISSNLSETSIYRDDEEWWAGLPCSIQFSNGLLSFLSLGASGRALVVASATGPDALRRFYWRYLDEDGAPAYLDFSVADMAVGVQVPNGVFLSRSGRMLFGSKVYKDGELIYSDNLFATSFGANPVVRTSFLNDGHWQYMVDGPVDRPAVSKLVYNTETGVWAPQVVRYLPHAFDKVTDLVLEPAVPGTDLTGVEIALEVAFFFGLEDTAELASYSGISAVDWESAAESYINGDKAALLGYMYDVFILQYIEVLGDGATIEDVLLDYYGEEGHTEPELQAETYLEHESDMDNIVAGADSGTPAVYATVNIDTYDSFWLEEFVP